MTLENAKYLLEKHVHYGSDTRYERVCTSQQYRSIRGMLNSPCKEAQRAAIEFITYCMYVMYPTDKDRFYFRTERGGWSIVS